MISNTIRFIIFCTVTILSTSSVLLAQQAVKHAIPPGTDFTTSHTVTIKGQKIPYNATAGSLPVLNAQGEPEASVFYVYYERSDVKNKERRPLVVSFNGGPGSASVWMHIGYTGPRFLHIDDEGYPVQPYGFTENPHSVLDVADIVYVDPVNTGFSRVISDEAKRETFFGVNADIKYLAEWISSFVTHINRWESPKYLIGESYGTTRVSGLALELQQSHWMFLNGVILVSPTGLGIERDGPVSDALTLPYYAATAWYHQQLKEEYQRMSLPDLLQEVEDFTLHTLIPAMVKGSTLNYEEMSSIAAKMSAYSGISTETLLRENLRVSTSLFWKELRRDEGMTVGRLDSRYTGLDKKDGGERYDFDPALTAWNHAFTPAINIYLRGELGVKTDLRYWIFGPVHPWDRSGDQTGESLRKAMAMNPYLHVLVQSGYFDGGTDYFNAKYTMWQMDPAGKVSDRMYWKGYESGHMMYLRQEDLETSNQDIREFILTTIPAAGEPALYSK